MAEQKLNGRGRHRRVELAARPHLRPCHAVVDVAVDVGEKRRRRHRRNDGDTDNVGGIQGTANASFCEGFSDAIDDFFDAATKDRTAASADCSPFSCVSERMSR